MAIIYGKNTAVDYAAGNLASFGKSYSRMGAAPLDMYEVWYDYDKLVEYASFRGNDVNGNPVYDGNTEVVDTSAVTSYVGQKVAYVNETEGKIYHYSIELNGSLKEIGTSPIGDNKSIVVATDGTVSLKGVDALVFEREVDVLDEDGQPTGEKRTENVQFQPLMTKDGLIWVEPSKTTVEGLASLINGLTARVSALENDRVTEEELAAAVKAETDRAMAAEKALGERIDAIDFVDGDELADAIKDFTTKNYVDGEIDKVEEAIAAIDFIDETELATALTPYAKTADVNTELDKKAKQTDLEALQSRVDAFLTGEGTEAALDSLQELIAYIDRHDDVDIAGILEDIQGLENKVVLGTDAEGKEYTTVKAYVEAAIAALAIGDYAKASDLVDLAARVKTLEDVDNFTQAEFNTFKTENDQAIATAKQEAIDAAALAVTDAAYATKAELEAHEEAAAEAYATKDELTAHEEAAAEAYATKQALADHETAADGKYATKQALADHESAADGKYATKEFVGTFTTGEDNYKDITTVVGYINKKAEETLAAAQGGSSETAASVKLQLDNYKTENDAKVQKNTNDIAALQGQLGTTDQNVSGILTRLGALETEVGVEEKSRIDVLEGVLNGAGDTEGLVAIVTGHGTKIGNLETADARIEKKADDNATAILALQNRVDTGDKNVSTYVADAIKAVTDTHLNKEQIEATYATIAALNGVKSDLAILVGEDKTDDGKPAMSVRDIVKAEVGSAGHLKRVFVSSLEEIGTPKADTIYMVGKNNAVEAVFTSDQAASFPEEGSGTSGPSWFDGAKCAVYPVTAGTTYTIESIVNDTTVWNEAAFMKPSSINNGYSSCNAIEVFVPSAGLTKTAPEEATLLYINYASDAESPVVREGASNDIYKEYILNDAGELVQIGDTSVNLAGYATEDWVTNLVNNSTPAKFEAGKLGTILGAVDTVVDGKTEITKNAVYAKADGTGEVKAVSTDILVNGEMTLVLNGGNATGKANA